MTRSSENVSDYSGIANANHWGMRIEFSFLVDGSEIAGLTHPKHRQLAEEIVATTTLSKMSGSSAMVLFGYASVESLELADKTVLLVRYVRDDRIKRLTGRQVEVAECAVFGATAGEIARHLGISVHTVRQHIRGIYQALEVCTRVELARVFGVV